MHQPTTIVDIKTQYATGFRAELRTALIVGSVVLLASWLGIITRPTGYLALFWPANALLLGLLVRAPRLATPAGWTAALAGYIAADYFAGTDSLLKTLLFSCSDMASVITGYWMYSRCDENIRHLKRPRSIFIMLRNVAAAGAAAGLLGAFIDPFLFQGTPLRGWLFWFATEIVNYMAILPVIFSAPQMTMRLFERRQYTPMSTDMRRAAPIAALILSCALSVLLGGLAALAFPAPALLWCAATYGVFTIALLTLGFSLWTLIAITTGMIDPSISGSLIATEISIRIGLTLAALAPMTLVLAMQARKELLRRLLHIASHDQLTGLLNRHAFRQRCNQLLTQLVADGKPVSLLMIDIDHFKKVNDTHGAAVGDQALTDFSRIARNCLRNSDVLGRLGGAEFAVLLPDCLHGGAHIVAERIRQTIATTMIELDSELQLSMTVSIGAAITREAPPEIDPLLLAADRALFRAKSSGRNRVVESEFQFDPIRPAD